MAGDAARAGAVSVLARRVVRRVLVLAGLVVAGWLLGCAAQSAAHADAVPAVPPQVVAGTPVLAPAVETAPRPVGHVMRAVVPERAPLEHELTQVAVPSSEKPEIRLSAEKAREGGGVPVARFVPVPRRRVAKVVRAAPAAGGRAVHRVVRQHRAPLRAPVRPDDHSAVGNSVASGVIAGFPDVLGWTPAPARASIPRVLGAVPPAVRTAADEPSFAPD